MAFAPEPGCADDTFGPWAGPLCRGGFDFTLLFEESILSILLQSIFILCLPIRLLQLMKLSPKVAPGLRRPIKAVRAPFQPACSTFQYRYSG